MSASLSLDEYINLLKEVNSTLQTLETPLNGVNIESSDNVNNTFFSVNNINYINSNESVFSRVNEERIEESDKINRLQSTIDLWKSSVNEIWLMLPFAIDGLKTLLLRNDNYNERLLIDKDNKKMFLDVLKILIDMNQSSRFVEFLQGENTETNSTERWLHLLKEMETCCVGGVSSKNRVQETFTEIISMLDEFQQCNPTGNSV